MIQQIVVIGGGTSFDTHEDYLSSLKNKEVSLEKLRPRRDWKDTLVDNLGKNFDVLLPRMPNGTNARYEEWKIWLERIIPLLNKNVVFIGHSLGGIFLAKYLSENIYPKTIKATILVSAPFNDANGEESLADFKLPPSLGKFAKQGGMIYLFHSYDDPVVPFEQLGKYKKALPNAKITALNGREHFNQEAFPEIVKLIRTLRS